jgi:hypothetical protein
VAHYSEQLTRYFDALGTGQVHVVVFDDLVADTAGCYQAVLEFLDVDQTFRPDLPVVNANKVARSGLMVRLLRSPPPFVRRLGRMAVQDQKARRALGGRLQSLNAGRQSRPPIDPDLRRSLGAEFDSEVATLGALLGRDLSGWCSPVAQPS